MGPKNEHGAEGNWNPLEYDEADLTDERGGTLQQAQRAWVAGGRVGFW